MTAKEFVLSKKPTARAEKHKSGKLSYMGETYWLIREAGDKYYIAEGKTESNAWVNAKKQIIEEEQENLKS